MFIDLIFYLVHFSYFICNFTLLHYFLTFIILLLINYRYNILFYWFDFTLYYILLIILDNTKHYSCDKKYTEELCLKSFNQIHNSKLQTNVSRIDYHLQLLCLITCILMLNWILVNIKRQSVKSIKAKKHLSID